MTRHLLAIFAHPDDEAFNGAGSFAMLTDARHNVTLVCATRGEAGQISDPTLATQETLGAVREAELHDAMAHVGVRDIRFLNFRDSGMQGSQDNAHPHAFINADPGGVAKRLLDIIDDVQPDAVLTFGPEGVYGHPDHLMMHRTATAAIALANGRSLIADPIALYYSAVPRSRIQRMAQRQDGPFRQMPPEMLALLGTPDDQITTERDVSSVLERKLAAIMAHRTQIGPDGPYRGLPRDEVHRYLSTERFQRAAMPYAPSSSRYILDDGHL